jgi:microcompartment protein CcmK/EutM
MDLARVIGTIVSTQKDPLLEGQKLAIVQPLDENLDPAGKPLIATDLGARHGRGEIVFLVKSGDAMMTGPTEELIPVDLAVVGIVDEIHVDARLRNAHTKP